MFISYYTFWQYADSGSNPGDQDVFNGSQASLVKYVRGPIDRIRRADERNSCRLATG